MSILDNLEAFLENSDRKNTESAWDEEFSWEPNNLSQKLFSETVCKDCESNRMIQTDNMGREKFWEDLGRPIDSQQ